MLLVRLYGDLGPGQKAPGIPDSWPAEVEEVPDSWPDPGDGRLLMKEASELEAYKDKFRTDYEAWAAVADLGPARAGKFEAIDTRTSALIEDGFPFAGKVFSLSISAQSTFTGLYAIRDEPALTFPVKVNTIDDLDFLELKDSAQVRAFYLTAVATYRTHLDGGTKLKDEVRAAVSVDAVAAVEDTR